MTTMTIDDALRNIHRLYLDSSPIIYFVEGQAQFGPKANRVFHFFQTGAIRAVTGPVTLAECLVAPYKNNDQALAVRLFRTILQKNNCEYWADPFDAILTAKIRAKYNLRLPDAFQVAAAINSACDAILTNDADWKRLTDIPVLVLSELDL
jgi:predicted nucleic acid-binding protein